MLYNNARWYRMLNNSAIYAVIWHVMKHWHDSGQPARCAPIHSQPDSFITRQAILPICFHFQILKVPPSCLRRATLQQAIPKLCQILTTIFNFQTKIRPPQQPTPKMERWWYMIRYIVLVRCLCPSSASVQSETPRSEDEKSSWGHAPSCIQLGFKWS